MNSREFRTAMQQWFSDYPFQIFSTLTFYGFRSQLKNVPSWCAQEIDKHLRDCGKRLRMTFAAHGIITLGHSGHLHAHLLVLEKNRTQLDDAQISCFDDLWPHLAETKRVDALLPLAS